MTKPIEAMSRLATSDVQLPNKGGMWVLNIVLVH